MRRLDPAGHPFGPDDYVFGNELGKRVGSFKKAWQTLVLKAHGYTAHWQKGRWTALDAESKARYLATTRTTLQHKRCTNGSTRDSARLRRKLATPIVISG